MILGFYKLTLYNYLAHYVHSHSNHISSICNTGRLIMTHILLSSCLFSLFLWKVSAMLFSILHLCAALASSEIFLLSCLPSKPPACISMLNNDNILPLTSTSFSSPQAEFLTVLYLKKGLLSGNVQWKQREEWQSWCGAGPAQSWVSV